MSQGNRILIIDDHPLFRKGVAQLIAMAPHLQVVGEASNGGQGVAMAKELDPDMILLDLHMTGTGGLRAGSGAAGCLLKDREPEDLLAAIDEALNGRTVIGERLNGLLARAIRDEAAAKQRDTAALTDREKQILKGLAQGLSNKVLALNYDV